MNILIIIWAVTMTIFTLGLIARTGEQQKKLEAMEPLVTRLTLEKMVKDINIKTGEDGNTEEVIEAIIRGMEENNVH